MIMFIMGIMSIICAFLAGNSHHMYQIHPEIPQYFLDYFLYICFLMAFVCVFNIGILGYVASI